MKSYQETFSFSKGLAIATDVPRNTEMLEECVGLFVDNNGLTTHEADSVLTLPEPCQFPYPQVFQLKELKIACFANSIYEYKNGSWFLKVSALVEDRPWTIADFYSYLVLCNGKYTIVRDINGTYSRKASNIPVAACCLDLNGQLIIGAPAMLSYEVSNNSNFAGVLRSYAAINSLYKDSLVIDGTLNADARIGDN